MKKLFFPLLLLFMTGMIHSQSWNELDSVSNEYQRIGDYENAIRFGENALTRAEIEFGKRDTNYAKSLISLAKLYSDMAEYDKAEPMINEALLIYKEASGGKGADYAVCMRRLADLYEDKGQYDNAEQLYFETLQIYKETLGESNADYANLLTSFAILYFDKGLYDKCESMHVQALNVRKEVLGVKHPDYGKSLLNLANLYNVTGHYDEAEPLYRKALQIFKEVYTEKHPLYATVLNNMGAMYSDMGLYDEAVTLFLEALEIRQELLGEKHPLCADCLNNLAIAYMKMNEFDKAEKFYLKALQMYKEISGEKNPNYAASLNNLAILYKDAKQYEKAEPLIKESLRIIKELFGEVHPTYADFLNTLANLYEDQGKETQAEKLYKKTLNIRKKTLGVKHPNYAETLSNLAILYFDNGKYDKAEKLFLKANKNILAQFKTYFPVLSEKEKLQFLKKFDELDFQIFNSLCLNVIERDPVLASELLELSIAKKGLVLSSAIDVRKRILGSKDSSAMYLFNRLTNVRMAISNAYTLTIDEQKYSGINLDSLESQANDIEKELSRKSGSVKIDIEERNIKWRDIQSQLQSDEAAIEFIDFQYYNKRWTDTTYYYAIIVRPEYKYPQLIHLAADNQLKDYFKDKDLSEDRESYVKNITTNKKLYSLIWSPLETKLEGVKIVYISPTGLLNKISFDALAVSDSTLLIDKYDLHYVGNLKDIVLNKAHTEKTISDVSLKTAAVFGGSRFDISGTDTALIIESVNNLKRGENSKEDSFIYSSDKISFMPEETRGWTWNYLEGTLKEAMAIGDLFKENNWTVSLDTGYDASEDAVKRLSYESSPFLLHISTHGFFYPEPPKNYKIKTRENVFRFSENPLLRSGIVLSGANRIWEGGNPIEGLEDGVLSAYEVSNLNLYNTELVVLSACQTGLGDIKGGEGVFGLQRAFKTAGANSIIMSLWKVPDRQTVELMELFYKNWLGGMTKHGSFTSAQLEMRRKYEPYYWAAFVMVE